MKKVNNIDIAEIAKQHELIFIPSPQQRAAKAKFWKRVDFDPSLAERISVAGVIQLTNNPTIQSWWKEEGFQEWFCNKDEATERIEYLYMLWTDKVEELLLNPEANHNAIINAGKLLMQLSGRDNSNNERFADDNIQKMSKAQLQTFIEKMAPRLVSQKKDPEVKEDTDGKAE